MGSPIDNLERMLAQGKDTALLRYSLGNEYLKAGQPVGALPHLEQAVKFDPGYSAAWKLLGKAFAASGRNEQALAAWRRGIEVAETKGDKQAAAEMKVFARRLERERPAS
ncbi:MAG TPA: tetratricopeptide repeat protein [Burkholderiales bacterium]|nr:tetratricopeptide repeat protein [Burkholderiales bacterium]